MCACASETIYRIGGTLALMIALVGSAIAWVAIAMWLYREARGHTRPAIQPLTTVVHTTSPKMLEYAD